MDCLATNSQFGLPVPDQLELFARTGWDGFFCGWKSGETDLRTIARRARDCGLFFQSVHAPFAKAADFWHEDEEKARAAVDELRACIRASAEAGAPFVVAHAFIGFTEHDPSERGVARFAEAAEEAAACGVELALENTEGEEYLSLLMDRFAGLPHVGFCWDSGHELCYNRGRDLLALWGNRLLGTHLDDNLGVCSADGRIFWHDDLHLLPFDGKIDWTDAAARLVRAGWTGPLTYELNTVSKPGRHENDRYGAMPLADYLAEARARARRFGALVEEARRAAGTEQEAPRP